MLLQSRLRGSLKFMNHGTLDEDKKMKFDLSCVEKLLPSTSCIAPTNEPAPTNELKFLKKEIPRKEF